MPNNDDILDYGRFVPKGPPPAPISKEEAARRIAKLEKEKANL